MDDFFAVVRGKVAGKYIRTCMRARARALYRYRIYAD